MDQQTRSLSALRYENIIRFVAPGKWSMKEADKPVLGTCTYIYSVYPVISRLMSVYTHRTYSITVRVQYFLPPMFKYSYITVDCWQAIHHLAKEEDGLGSLYIGLCQNISHVLHFYHWADAGPQLKNLHNWARI